MIVPVQVKLKGHTKPQQRYALVFDDINCPGDFIVYRNALTTAVKEILSEANDSSCFEEELFFLLQLAEFISTSLDEIAEKKKAFSYEKEI